MGRQYRRQSISTWAFWCVLVIGGTLFGAYRFDWFPLGFLTRGNAPAETAEAKAPSEGETGSTKAPPDGQIEVAQQSPVGPQSEPPQSEFEEPGPGAKGAPPNSTKARLIEQRAEGPAPKLRANPTTPSSVEPAKAEDFAADSSPFNFDSSSSSKPQRKSGPIVQTANAVEEKVPAIDAVLEAQLETIDQLIAAN